MKKDLFDNIVIDMMCTEKDYGYVSEKDIISNIKKIDNLERKDRDGRTLLLNAAFYGRHKVIKYLIEKGADINTKDNNGYTCLHASVVSNNIKTVRLLIESGAEINAQDMYGNNMLLVADYGTDLQIISLLVANGADPKQKNNYGVSANDIFTEKEYLKIFSKKKD